MLVGNADTAARRSAAYQYLNAAARRSAAYQYLNAAARLLTNTWKNIDFSKP